MLCVRQKKKKPLNLNAFFTSFLFQTKKWLLYTYFISQYLPTSALFMKRKTSFLYKSCGKNLIGGVLLVNILALALLNIIHMLIHFFQTSSTVRTVSTYIINYWRKKFDSMIKLPYLLTSCLATRKPTLVRT